jgi:hypothetical protein
MGQPAKEVHPFVVDIDSGNPEADLHVDLNVPRSLPAEFFNRVILTQVLQLLHPETALANLWASIAPSGALLLTVPSMDRLDPHNHTIDFWWCTPNGLAELLRRAEIWGFVSGYGNVLTCASAMWGCRSRSKRRGAGLRRPALSLVARAYAEKPGGRRDYSRVADHHTTCPECRRPGGPPRRVVVADPAHRWLDAIP